MFNLVHRELTVLPVGYKVFTRAEDDFVYYV